jgi:hypothetical protein
MIWPPGSVGVRAIVNDPAPKRVRSNRSSADSQRWTYSPETHAPRKITGVAPTADFRSSAPADHVHNHEERTSSLGATAIVQARVRPLSRYVPEAMCAARTQLG